jgi:ABC-type siderophore export system fused ATPase/permease subunit
MMRKFINHFNFILSMFAIITLTSCTLLTALSALSGKQSNSGTQVKAHANIGDNKKQLTVNHKRIESKHNQGTIVGQNQHTYQAQTAQIKHENGLSYKEIFLFIGVILIIILAHRIPWGFWRKERFIIKRNNK